MPRIPDTELERLKEEVSVERLVEASGVVLKKAGKDLLGRCPFHDDAEASLVVTAAKNLWHCFGCQVGGGHAVELLKADPSLAAGQAGEVKRTTVRGLPAPVAFDADDRALLNQTIDYYHQRLLATTEAAAYRNVTAAYGVEGFTDELLAAFKAHGTQRVLIAYDRDDAGDRAAEKLAPRLMAEGIECWRIVFPKGMDANEYALKMQPADKALGLLIRKAVWMGNGQAPARTQAEPVATEVIEPPSLAAKEEAAAPLPTPEPIPAPTHASPLQGPTQASPLPDAPQPDVPAEQTDTDLVLVYGERRYRVRGWKKPLNPEALKVKAVRYIEVTPADIATANRLAHEVLGRTLDELPPQTRKLLTTLHAWVSDECLRQAIKRGDFRFSRRQVRELTGWGDTQLKVHLGRLAELEYLLVHRVLRGGGFEYELIYDAEGDAGGRFLMGLADLGSIGHDYDAKRSGANEARSAPGRGAVGGVSAGGRGGRIERNASNGADLHEIDGADMPDARSGPRVGVLSYPQPSFLAASTAAA
ncbi:MAG: toprim domain-containing protein [Burkholderiaceae bacterium]|nr:toprim domain-containing protein [Burkholderiaceae bacterium]